MTQNTDLTIKLAGIFNGNLMSVEVTAATIEAINDTADFMLGADNIADIDVVQYLNLHQYIAPYGDVEGTVQLPIDRVTKCAVVETNRLMGYAEHATRDRKWNACAREMLRLLHQEVAHRVWHPMRRASDNAYLSDNG